MRTVTKQVVQQLLRASANELAEHPPERIVRERLASNLLRHSIDSDAHRTHERLTDALIDDSLEQLLSHPKTS